jgi:hypothetical protein
MSTQTDRWVAVFAGARTALMREVGVPREAEAARADILAFLASDPKPELCDIFIVRNPDDIDISAMPPSCRPTCASRSTAREPDSPRP